MEIEKVRWWLELIKKFHKVSGSSKRKLYIIIFILFLIHMALSFVAEDFAWLGSFGALLSVLGILITISYSFPTEEIDENDLNPTIEGDIYIENSMPLGWDINDVNEIKKIKREKIKSILVRFENIGMYFSFTIIGTLIWAYAGFLTPLFFCIP